MGWLEILGVGSLIMLARIVDVTVGTLRVISVIDGRQVTAFCLGFVEVLIWLAVISVTVEKVAAEPVLAVFFALGFSTGNVLGIWVERRIPLGNLTLRVVGGEEVWDITAKVRELGLGATLIRGEGRDGERWVMFSFMPKKLLRKVLKVIAPHRDRVFYTLDYGGSSNRVLVPVSQLPAGPRRFFKRK